MALRPGRAGDIAAVNMELTEEQKKIVAFDVGPGDIFKVTAMAGTGKTTTLVAYAQARPHVRFLYVAFNKSVQVAAAARFPNNVVCRTSHALAFPRFGSKYKDRLVPGFKANTVRQALGLDSLETARFTIDTLNNYLVSADPKVSPRHVPHVARQYAQRRVGCNPDFVALANQLGKLMCNGKDPDIGMPHDGYLKLYQLSRPRLNYDCILMDESQDLNPVTAEYLLQQENTPKILVGDPHQQIYSFRGARDIMTGVNATREMVLTRSFRFNRNIATVANMILQRFKGEKRRVIGLKKKQHVRINKGYTLIARTNSKIFDEAVRLNGLNKKIGFVGGIEGYRLNRIRDAYYLYARRTRDIQDPYIRSFGRFSAMEGYAREVEDFEISALGNVVKEYNTRIPRLVETIRENAMAPEQADILLTTAHKAKGLEWPCVRLADDFPNLVAGDRIIKKDRLEADEFNLIYVAMTRAMDSLSFARGSSLIPFVKISRNAATN